jgi:hypothetical protein
VDFCIYNKDHANQSKSILGINPEQSSATNLIIAHNMVHTLRVEQLFRFSKTIHSAMYNTTSILDNASPLTDAESAFTVVVVGEGVGKLIRDLAQSDNARFSTALDTLS